MTYLDIYNINGGGMTQKQKFALFGVIALLVVSILIWVYIEYVIPSFNKVTDSIDPNDAAYDAELVASEQAAMAASEPAAMAASEPAAMAASEPAVMAASEPAAADVVSEPTAVVLADVPTEETVSSLSTGSQFYNKEPFTNDLPYQLNNTSINYSNDVDYNEVLQNMALDKGVISQHNNYVNDRNKITSTASFYPARSDTQDIVTTWGFTKLKYINIDPSARNVPSQDPEQGSKPITLKWS